MKRTWVVAMLIGVLTVAVYWPATRFQFVNLDDPAFISDNPHVQAGLTAEGFKWAWGSVVTGDWHPITMLSLMLDCQLFGVKPWWPHLVNILLHAANAMLLFGLLKRMTGAMWRSAVVAGFFALHPLHVESVAWVCERKDVLSTFFWLLTIWAYVGYADGSKAQGARRGVLYGLSLLLCALGMMSKPMVVTLPMTLLLLDYWPLGRKPAWGLIWEKIPYLVMSAGVAVATLWAQSHGGGLIGLRQIPIGVRVGNAAVGYVRYIGMMIWPRHLAGFYPMRAAPWPWWVVGLAALLLVMVSVLALKQRVRRPWLAMGWVWYVGTLLPVIGLLQAGLQAAADRFGYVPLIGLFVMVVWGGWEMAAGWRLGKPSAAAAACALALCAGLTVHQEFYWKDSETFNKRLIELMPHNFMGHNGMGICRLAEDRPNEALSNFVAALEELPTFAEGHNNAGIVLEKQGQIEEAIRQYKEAIRLKPEFPEAHNDLGNALVKKRQTDEAISEYKEAIRLKPDFVEAHYNLGMALNGMGRIDEAISHLREAIRVQRDFAAAHVELGIALGKKGRIEEAIGQYQEAIGLKADSFEAHYFLGKALNEKGRTNEAIIQFREALRRKGGFAEASYELGSSLADEGQTEEGIRNLREAIRQKPEYTGAHFKLARAFEKEGRSEEAIGEYREVIHEKPGDADIHNNVALALEKQGRLEEAIGQFREAIALKPEYADAHYNLALALLRQGQVDGAVHEMRQAIGLKVEHPEAHNILGVALGQKGQFEEAIREFREAIRLEPANYGAHFNLGMAYNKKGQTNEAIRELHETLRLAPDFVAAQKVLREMGEGN